MATSQSSQVTIAQEIVQHWGCVALGLLVAGFKLPSRRPSPR